MLSFQYFCLEIVLSLLWMLSNDKRNGRKYSIAKDAKFDFHSHKLETETCFESVFLFFWSYFSVIFLTWEFKIKIYSFQDDFYSTVIQTILVDSQLRKM